MIVPLKIPPGAFRNGTEYQAKGRWRDVNLVRWHESNDTMPVRGWRPYQNLDEGFYSDSIFTMNEPIGCMSWVDNSENVYMVWADQNEMWVMGANGTIYEVTPAGFAGSNEWVHFDTFGEIPVACGQQDGDIWEWDLNTSNNFTQVTNSPSGNVGLVVTDERFIMALQKRRVEWCDRDDRTVWTAAPTNQAGGFDLDTDGEILFGLQMRGETLIVGSRDCWVARYVGYPEVWEFRRIGRTSAVGGLCGAKVDDRAFWLGRDGFWQYAGGYVSRLPCEVWEYIRADISENNDVFEARARAISAWHNIAYSEVVWQYESGSSSTSSKDKYVSYNYQRGIWSYGESPFAMVAETNAFAVPLGLTDPGDDNGKGFDDTFSSDQGWTLGTNWQVSGGSLNQTSPAASSASFDLTIWDANEAVMVYVFVSGHTTGSLTVTFGTTTASITGNGTYNAVLTADSNPESLTVTADGTWDGEVTRLVVARVPVFELDTGSVYHYVNAPYAKTGPMEIAVGERRAHVTSVIPAEQDTGELSLTFYTREYPEATETTHGPYTSAGPTDVRFSGRQFAMRVEGSAAADWRSGTHRLKVVPGGRR